MRLCPPQVMKLLATIVALALSVRINSFATIDPGPGVEEPVVANIDAPADAPIQGGFEAPVDEPPVVEPGPQCVDGYLQVTCPDPGPVNWCDGVTCASYQYCCHDTTFGLCQDRELCCVDGYVERTCPADLPWLDTPEGPVDLCAGVRCRDAGAYCCPLTGLCVQSDTVVRVRC